MLRRWTDQGPTPFRTSSRTAAAVAATTAAALMLSACGSEELESIEGGQAVEEEQSAEVTDEALGEALEDLVFGGLMPDLSADGGTAACLVEAVRSADVSEAALEHLVETSGQDYMTVVESLAIESLEDAEVLMSEQMREEFESCAEGAVGTASYDEEVDYSAPEVAPEPPRQSEPNTEPSFEVDEYGLEHADTIEPGLVVMLQSYALDEEQERIYAAAGECLAERVLDAGFSTEALMFIAEGRPLGAGSVAEHLPTDADREIWEDETFLIRIADCVSNAQDDAAEEDEGQQT